VSTLHMRVWRIMSRQWACSWSTRASRELEAGRWGSLTDVKAEDVLLVGKGMGAHFLVAVIVEVERLAEEILKSRCQSGRNHQSRVARAYQAVQVMHALHVNEKAGPVLLVPLYESVVEATCKTIFR
jgi:UDP-N-acetylglucosamine:LPS N-acetylglucosamine transferase